MSVDGTSLEVKSGRTRLRPCPFDLLCVAVVLGIVVVWLPAPRLSPDAWSYFELSKSVFTDFYRINTYRQYQTPAPYGTSFPPLYPVLLAVSRCVADVGIYTGVFLNALCCVATLVVLKSLVKVLGAPGWAGSVVFLMLLARPEYLIELLGARSFPLALLFFAALLRVYVSPGEITPSRAALMGSLAGLTVMTRFDFLAAAMFLGVVLAWYARKRMLPVACAFFGLLLVALAPWIVYSLAHFSKPLISDNSRTAMLVRESFVTDYLPDEAKLKHAWDDPVGWVANVVTRRFPKTMRAAARAVVNNSALLILAGVLLGVIVAVRAGPRSESPEADLQSGGAYSPRWAGFVAVLLVQWVTVGMTGYALTRYFLPLQLFLSLVLVHAIGKRVDLRAFMERWPRSCRRIAALVCAAAVVGVAVLPGASRWASAWRAKLAAKGPQESCLLDRDVLTADRFADLVNALHHDTDEPRILILSGVNAYEFGALTGCTTFYEPANFNAELFAPFIKAYKVTHVLDVDSELLGEVSDSAAMSPMSTPGLVRIDAESDDESEADAEGDQ